MKLEKKLIKKILIAGSLASLSLGSCRTSGSSIKSCPAYVSSNKEINSAKTETIYSVALNYKLNN